MYKRTEYLDRIRPFYEKDLIKVITGIRRCGKSVLLTQIIDELKENKIKEEQIIYLNLEIDDYDFIKDYKDLSNYIKSKMKFEHKYYIFVDEIQYVKNWEKSINSFKAKYHDNISIFITGSNSDLLSGELSTLLSGRYVFFEIQPCNLNYVINKSHI